MIDLAELRERMVRVDTQLKQMAFDNPPSDTNYHRLLGKAEGVRLALSYLDEAERIGG